MPAQHRLESLAVRLHLANQLPYLLARLCKIFKRYSEFFRRHEKICLTDQGTWNSKAPSPAVLPYTSHLPLLRRAVGFARESSASSLEIQPAWAAWRHAIKGNFFQRILCESIAHLKTFWCSWLTRTADRVLWLLSLLQVLSARTKASMSSSLLPESHCLLISSGTESFPVADRAQRRLSLIYKACSDISCHQHIKTG